MLILLINLLFLTLFLGNSWIEVEQPEESLLLNQISIGYNGLWAITRDYRVWFRKGIYGESAGICENLAKGSGWVEMLGNMSNISVASNDQVWAVGAEDKLVIKFIFSRFYVD